uniref:BAR domain-containing protein n=1 Tax=Hyaloperonospora arabidopsidis (strain Emoy2) TaxID=559515 RepID=M4BLN4_HYAAE
MSSLRVRTKNKLMMALGAVKPSTNVAFDLVYSDFESTLQRLVKLDSVLKTYVSSLKRCHGAASSVMVAIEDLSPRGNRTMRYQQTSAGSLEMNYLAGEARVACADVDRVVFDKICDRLEHEVLVPVNKWLQDARNLQSKVSAFEMQKALYDHYSRKVVVLREAHERRVSNGRREKTKSTERMFRNKQKFVATSQSYTQLSETIIRELRAFVLARDAALTPLLYRVLQGRIMHAERLNEATNRIRALVEDSLENSDHRMDLGEFVTTARGNEYAGSEVCTLATAASAHPDKFMVRESSFETFVGEAAHQAAPQLSTLKSASNDGGKACALFSASLSKSEMQVPSWMRRGAGLAKPGYTPPHGIPRFMKANVSTNSAANKSRDHESSVMAVPTRPAKKLLASPSSRINTTKRFWNIFSAASAPSIDR